MICYGEQRIDAGRGVAIELIRFLNRFLFREIKRLNGDSIMLIKSLTILLKYFHRLLHRVAITKLDMFRYILSMCGNPIVLTAVMRLNYLYTFKTRYAVLIVSSIQVHVIARTNKSI